MCDICWIKPSNGKVAEEQSYPSHSPEGACYEHLVLVENSQSLVS
jgi:hypothetical protein